VVCRCHATSSLKIFMRTNLPFFLRIGRLIDRSTAVPFFLFIIDRNLLIDCLLPISCRSAAAFLLSICCCLFFSISCSIISSIGRCLFLVYRLLPLLFDWPQHYFFDRLLPFSCQSAAVFFCFRSAAAFLSSIGRYLFFSIG